MLGMVCLAISSAALSLAPYFFGKVINYSIPGTNWYDSMYPKVSILYLASKIDFICTSMLYTATCTDTI